MGVFSVGELGQNGFSQKAYILHGMCCTVAARAIMAGPSRTTAEMPGPAGFPRPCRVDSKLREPQALCICPTRELVVQNLSVLLRMGKFTGIQVRTLIITCQVLLGGIGYQSNGSMVLFM